MARRSAKQQHNPHRRQNLHYPQSMPFSLASLSLSHSIVLSRFSQNLLINEIPKILPSSSSSNQTLHNTFSPSKRDSENKAENKQTTENSQNLHKQTNEKRKQKEEERIIFIEQKNYTNFITRNSQ
jgi:hypothetical protein